MNSVLPGQPGCCLFSLMEHTQVSFVEDSSPGLWFPHLSLLSLRLPRLSELMDRIAPRSHLREAQDSVVVISQTRRGLPRELGLSQGVRTGAPGLRQVWGASPQITSPWFFPCLIPTPLLLTGRDSLVLSFRGLGEAGVLGCLRGCSGTAR